jgi:hypothetical protein
VLGSLNNLVFVLHNIDAHQEMEILNDFLRGNVRKVSARRRDAGDFLTFKEKPRLSI